MNGLVNIKIQGSFLPFSKNDFLNLFSQFLAIANQTLGYFSCALSIFTSWIIINYLKPVNVFLAGEVLQTQNEPMNNATSNTGEESKL